MGVESGASEFCRTSLILPERVATVKLAFLSTERVFTGDLAFGAAFLPTAGGCTGFAFSLPGRIILAGLALSLFRGCTGCPVSGLS